MPQTITNANQITTDTYHLHLKGASRTTEGRLLTAIAAILRYRSRDLADDRDTRIERTVRFVRAVYREYNQPLNDLSAANLSRLLERLTTELDKPLPTSWGRLL